MGGEGDREEEENRQNGDTISTIIDTKHSKQ